MCVTGVNWKVKIFGACICRIQYISYVIHSTFFPFVKPLCTLLKLLFDTISSRLCIIEDSKNLVTAGSTVIGLTFSIIGQLDSSLLISSNLPQIRKEGIEPVYPLFE